LFFFYFFIFFSYASSWTSIFGYSARVYPPNYSKLLRAMQAAQSAIASVNGLTFLIGTDADVLSPASGGSDDYAFDVNILNRYRVVCVVCFFFCHFFFLIFENNLIFDSFTVELRGNSFVSPVSDIVPSGQEFSAGLVALLNSLASEAQVIKCGVILSVIVLSFALF
jgi:hypothetical protein